MLGPNNGKLGGNGVNKVIIEIVAPEGNLDILCRFAELLKKLLKELGIKSEGFVEQVKNE